MKGLMLLGFSFLYIFLFRNQLRMNRSGRINRYPWGKDLSRNNNPRRFRFAAIGSTALFIGFGALLAFAWYSFANGTLK
jgi:hypothetical protein